MQIIYLVSKKRAQKRMNLVSCMAQYYLGPHFSFFLIGKSYKKGSFYIATSKTGLLASPRAKDEWDSGRR